MSTEPFIKVEIRITERTLASLLCSALEGQGSMYWIKSLYAEDEKKDGRPWGDEYTPDYIRAPFSTSGALVIVTDGEGTKYLTRDAMQKGLQRMADLYPNRFADLLTEDSDANTADVWLQMALFDAILFG